MNHNQLTVRILLLLICLVLLGGLLYYFISTGMIQVPFLSSNSAISPVAQAPVSSTSLVPPTAPSKPSVPVLPTTPPSNPPPTAPPAPSALLTITNADSGKTIDLALGQEFAVNLGSLNWKPEFAPNTSVVQVSASTTGAAQGIYKTTAAGTVSMTASGSPICRENVACPMFIALFTATLDVH